MGLGLNRLNRMPNYDYLCEKCGHEFEVFQSMNDEKLTVCPQEECGGSVRRLLGTGAGIIFKGGGFYETDYRSESYKKGASKDEGTGKEKAGSKAADKKKEAGTKSGATD
jgi:putative FmdB family regulatory protein